MIQFLRGIKYIIDTKEQSGFNKKIGPLLLEKA